MLTQIIQRTKSVWKSDFLALFIESENKSHKITWLFWIVTGLIAATIWTLSVTYFVNNAFPIVTEGIEQNIPDGAQLSVMDGILSIEGIEQPYVIEGDEDGSVLIIDTEGVAYSPESLDAYTAAVLVTKEGIYQKEDLVRSREFSFAEAKDFTYSKEQLMALVERSRSMITIGMAIGIFLAMTLNFIVFRLLGALWWALLLMLIAMFFGMKEKFSTYYFAVLNLYFVPLVLEGVLVVFGISIPFFTTLIFIILFLFNLLYWKKKNDSEIVSENLKNETEKVLPGTVLPTD